MAVNGITVPPFWTGTHGHPTPAKRSQESAEDMITCDDAAGRGEDAMLFT